MTPGRTDAETLATAIDSVDWPAHLAELGDQGWTVLPRLLSPARCIDLIALEDRGVFRSRIDMARHGYGSGAYGYFDRPLPETVDALRTGLYPRLLPLADHWAASAGADPFPPTHAGLLARCRAAGQTRPTCLLLRYGPGDYNRLHQDRYGACVFPLQTAMLLSAPGRDFTGGAFVLTEQRARMQSRVHVVPLEQGDAVVFAVDAWPVRTARGHARVHMRHGVATLTSGSRWTLGVIFHDAA